MVQFKKSQRTAPCFWNFDVSEKNWNISTKRYQSADFQKFDRKYLLLGDLVVLLEDIVQIICAKQIKILICYPCTYLHIKSISD